jgi:ammonia channel protein AmtB
LVKKKVAPMGLIEGVIAGFIAMSVLSFLPILGPLLAGQLACVTLISFSNRVISCYDIHNTERFEPMI